MNPVQPTSSAPAQEPAPMPARHEPIAIIGIGCRFPGGVHNPETFWQLLCNQVDAIGPMPADRYAVDDYYNAKQPSTNKIATNKGGFLDRIDQFDADFFGISPREANLMDPQQRLLLEVAWEALEDGGQAAETLAGSRTGVFIGMWTNEYEDKMFQAADAIDLYMTTGGGRYAASGRLSFVFDFRGPSLTLDTGCSSALVAIHLACQSLRQGESTLALAGGVNLLLEPQITIGYSGAKMLAPDAACKFGDARANGYVRSEGVGVVVLKSAAQAMADGDPIYALIRGSAANNDGQSSDQLKAPGISTQAAMLRQAYQDAGVAPGQVSYVEAHGTGTKVGDPVEIQALGQVLAEGRPPGRPCLLGSVKTNIGHTEAAAGVAGLIKAALALHHRLIPATLHFEIPNPAIPWAELPVQIQATRQPWPDEPGPAFAGVSSFGITGTNAHVVLQAAPVNANRQARDVTTTLDQPYVLPLSARSAEALQALAAAYHTLLSSSQPPALRDLCYTASVRRSHHDYRTAVVAASHDDLAEQLAALREGAGSSVSTVAHPARKIVFVFPGQGSQWLGMGCQLLAREPLFRTMIEQCDAAFRPYVGWSLLAELQAAAAHSRLEEIDVIQPALFAIQVALAALWHAWGVTPDAVIGHSLGEVAAAYVAGALSLDDAAKVICLRSQLMKEVAGQGEMAVVELSLAEAQLAISGYTDLAVAVNNSPRSTVVAGAPDQLQQLLNDLATQGIFCRRVKVDVAAHSTHMEALKPRLVAALADLHPTATTVPFYSTVTGQVQIDTLLDTAYWGQNLRQPVLFAAALQAALADGGNTFIELSPHPVLISAIEQGFAGQSAQAQDALAAVASGRRASDELITMRQALGTLYTLGYPVAWPRLYPHGGRYVPVPTYPWQRERFWLDDLPGVGEANRATTMTVAALAAVHPPVRQADLAEWFYTVEWQVQPRASQLPVVAQRSGHWVVFADQGGTGAALAEWLRQQGNRTTLVYAGAAWCVHEPDHYTLNPRCADHIKLLFEAIFETAHLACRGILCCWSLDDCAELSPTPAAWQDALHTNVDTVLQLLQTAAALHWASSPKLWVFTQGVQPIAQQLTARALIQSPLWGLGRVAATEHPELWGGLIDLDPQLTADAAAAQIGPELWTPDGEGQLAFYGGKRYVARLVRAVQPRKRQPAPTWRTDASYLITGGLGALGLAVAGWLVAQGVRRLILLARTPLPPRIEWQATDPTSPAGARIAAIRALENQGATVHLATVDVADEGQFTAFLEQYHQEGWPLIRGVIHAAGVNQDQLLTQLTPQLVRPILRAKVIGSWLIHQHLTDLDLFITFSSMRSIIGYTGTGAYAAANAFLDTLAHYRQRQGQPALTINWGPWDNLGMLSSAKMQQVVQAMQDDGFPSFDAAAGLAALGQLLQRTDQPQLAVMPIDWAKFKASHGDRRPSPFFATLLQHKTHPSAVTDDTSSLRQQLLTRETGQRPRLLTGYLQEQIGKILQRPPARIAPHKPLGALGLDSLMGLELRNRLERALGVALSATLVWNYPTVAELTTYLLGKLALPAAVHSAGTNPLPTTTAPLPGPAAASVAASTPNKGDNGGDNGRHNGKQRGRENEKLSAIVAEVSELSDDEALQRLLSQA